MDGHRAASGRRTEPRLQADSPSPHRSSWAKARRGIDVLALDERLGRGAGALLGDVGLSDVVDAAIVLLSHDGGNIVTSHPDDFSLLVAASDRHVELIRP